MTHFTLELGTKARRSLRGPDWLREPLLHFALLGLLLFAVDHALSTRSDDPRVIVVSRDVDRQALEVFKAARGREPSRDELYALRRVWLDNEVLYREGVALRLDQGDPAIRERVIFKSLAMIDSGLRLPPHDESTLRTWFDQHRSRYDQPARYDFQEAVLYGDNSEFAIREFADALNRGAPGDARAGLRVFKSRPHGNVVDSYGAEFAKSLADAPPGQWRAFRTGDTVRVMKLDAITPAKHAAFENMHGVVLHDWTDAVMAEQRTAAVRELAKKFTVRYGDHP